MKKRIGLLCVFLLMGCIPFINASVMKDDIGLIIIRFDKPLYTPTENSFYPSLEYLVIQDKESREVIWEIRSEISAFNTKKPDKSLYSATQQIIYGRIPIGFVETKKCKELLPGGVYNLGAMFNGGHSTCYFLYRKDLKIEMLSTHPDPNI